MNQVSSQPDTARREKFILVVEDEMLVQIMVSDPLRDAGFNVIEAFNADEAIRILHSGVKIDLMLSDVRMPGSMDGLGLLEY
jgi:CheY-like chemotaxis protein